MYYSIKSAWSAENWINEYLDSLSQQEIEDINQQVQIFFSKNVLLPQDFDKIINTHIYTMLCQLLIVSVKCNFKLIKECHDDKVSCLISQSKDCLLALKILTQITLTYVSPNAVIPFPAQSIEKLEQLIQDSNHYDLGILSLISACTFKSALSILLDYQILPAELSILSLSDSSKVEPFIFFFSQLKKQDRKLNCAPQMAESYLINHFFISHNYGGALVNVLCSNGFVNFIEKVDTSYKSNMHSCGIKTTAYWQIFIKSYPSMIKQVGHDYEGNDCLVETTSTRKIFISNWKTESAALLQALIEIDVSALKFFEGGYSTNTITALMLQTVCKIREENKLLRNYICHEKIYNAKDNYVHLVVTLPGDNNHIGMIKLKDCHKMSLEEIFQHVKHDVEIMTYCRYKSEELAKKNPHLIDLFNRFYLPNEESLCESVNVRNPIFSVSNIGPWGSRYGLSPLFPGEVLKVVLSQVERKQVWNNRLKVFEIQDRLPISVNSDHRIYDGNISLAKMTQIAFDEMYSKMKKDEILPEDNKNQFSDLSQFISITNKILKDNIELGYLFMKISSHQWVNGVKLGSILSRLKSSVSNMIQRKKHNVSAKL